MLEWERRPGFLPSNAWRVIIHPADVTLCFSRVHGPSLTSAFLLRRSRTITRKELNIRNESRPHWEFLVVPRFISLSPFFFLQKERTLFLFLPSVMWLMKQTVPHVMKRFTCTRGSNTGEVSGSCRCDISDRLCAVVETDVWVIWKHLQTCTRCPPRRSPSAAPVCVCDGRHLSATMTRVNFTLNILRWSATSLLLPLSSQTSELLDVCQIKSTWEQTANASFGPAVGRTGTWDREVTRLLAISGNCTRTWSVGEGLLLLGVWMFHLLFAWETKTCSTFSDRLGQRLSPSLHFSGEVRNCTCKSK